MKTELVYLNIIPIFTYSICQIRMYSLCCVFYKVANVYWYYIHLKIIYKENINSIVGYNYSLQIIYSR